MAFLFVEARCIVVTIQLSMELIPTKKPNKQTIKTSDQFQDCLETGCNYFHASVRKYSLHPSDSICYWYKNISKNNGRETSSMRPYLSMVWKYTDIRNYYMNGMHKSPCNSRMGCREDFLNQKSQPHNDTAWQYFDEMARVWQNYHDSYQYQPWPCQI